MSRGQELILFAIIALVVTLTIAIVLTLLAAGREGRSKPYFKLIAVIGSVVIVLLDIYVVNPLLPSSGFLTILIIIVPCLAFGALLRHIASSRD
jgi:hypothetical protein